MTRTTLLKKAQAKLLPILHSTNGPMTADLVQRPASFGLGNLPSNMQPDSLIYSTCGFCATGCGLEIHIKDDQPINVTPQVKYPVNLGMACPKGWEAVRVLAATDRGTTPLLKNSNGLKVPVDWKTAISEFCDNFKTIQAEHGNASVAFLSTGQIVCEEMAFLGTLAKFGMNIVHGDGNTRQCMATAATAYKQSFGFDAPPYTYADFEQSDCIVLIGSNLCIAHPIMWQRVLRNKNNPEIIVIDPRQTETAMGASEHLQLKPKSDLTLFYGLANLLIQRGAVDENFIAQSTNDFEAFKVFVAEYTLEKVCGVSGIDEEQLNRVADKIAAAKAASFWWTMGVNQSYEGTRTAQALINIAMMTGNIGRPGTGGNSITGQCNAMGSRLYSNTTNLIGGHDFLNPADRKKVADALDIPESVIPQSNSWAYDQIIDGIENGTIRGLWIIATNTSHSWINSPRGQQLLGKLDYLVVQDMYHSTETAVQADLYLPAAGWGEKEGVFINSERRLGVCKRVAKAPGQALADFSIFRLIAERWGCGDMFASWTSPAAAFEKMKAVSAGQPCDITGIKDYAMIQHNGGIQWPLPKDENATELNNQKVQQERRLFEDGRFYHADGKAKFLFESPTPNAEPTDEEYPLMLLTGRGTVSQWHTQTRTAKSPLLRKLYPANCYIEIHPLQARQFKLNTGDMVRVTSRRGSIECIAMVTASVGSGQCFMPMHYSQTNHLTWQHVDPYSRQPSYKNSAIRISKAVAAVSEGVNNHVG